MYKIPKILIKKVKNKVKDHKKKDMQKTGKILRQEKKDLNVFTCKIG